MRLHREIAARLDDRSWPATEENIIDVCQTGLDTIAACRAGSSDWYERREWTPFQRAFEGAIVRAKCRIKERSGVCGKCVDLDATCSVHQS